VLGNLAAQEDRFVFLPICQGTQFTSCPTRKPYASEVRGAFDVITRAGGDVPRKISSAERPPSQRRAMVSRYSRV